MVMEDKLIWFEKLYDTYSDAIFRHLYLRLGDRERAKELTQDVFMRAWQQVASGVTIEHEKAWLYRSAHNAFVNEIRTDKRRESLDTMIEESGYDIRDEGSDTSVFTEQRELLQYLNQLKDSYRTVLVMRYIDDLPVTEIASTLEESETNISMRLKRALQKLRKLYETTNPTHYE
jgi:RNA polymerase sigma-70 factor (ECF subfamily)